VEHDLLERLAALRRHEQAEGVAAGGERLLDRAPAGDQLLALAQRLGDLARRGANGWPRLEAPARVDAAARVNAPARLEAAARVALAERRPRRAATLPPRATLPLRPRPLASITARRATPSGPEGARRPTSRAARRTARAEGAPALEPGSRSERPLR
jgi:hypothetical protein